MSFQSFLNLVDLRGDSPCPHLMLCAGGAERTPPEGQEWCPFGAEKALGRPESLGWLCKA